jgi:hypothetical protein
MIGALRQPCSGGADEPSSASEHAAESKPQDCRLRTTDRLHAAALTSKRPRPASGVTVVCFGFSRRSRLSAAVTIRTGSGPAVTIRTGSWPAVTIRTGSGPAVTNGVERLQAGRHQFDFIEIIPIFGAPTDLNTAIVAGTIQPSIVTDLTFSVRVGAFDLQGEGMERYEQGDGTGDPGKRAHLKPGSPMTEIMATYPDRISDEQGSHGRQRLPLG